MAIYSPEIGTLMNAIQSKGQTQINSLQTQRSKGQSEMLESKYKSQKIDNIYNAVMSVAQAGEQIYSLAENESKELAKVKNEKDLTSATIGLSTTFANIANSVNTSISNGTAKLEGGNVNFGTDVTEQFESAREAVENLIDINEVTREALNKTIDDTEESYKLQAIPEIYKRDEDANNALKYKKLDIANAEDQTNKDPENKQSTAVINTFTQYSPEVRKSMIILNNADNATAIAISGYKESVLIDGIKQTKLSIYDDDDISDENKQPAINAAQNSIDVARLRATEDATKTLEDWKADTENTEMKVSDRHDGFFLSWTDVYTKFNEKLESAPPEIVSAVRGVLQQEQQAQLINGGVFKSMDELALMESDEIIVYKRDLEAYKQNGVLIGQRENYFGQLNDISTTQKNRITEGDKVAGSKLELDEAELALNVAIDKALVKKVGTDLNLGNISGSDAMDTLALYRKGEAYSDTIKLGAIKLLASLQSDDARSSPLIKATSLQDINIFLDEKNLEIDRKYDPKGDDDDDDEQQIAETQKHINAILLDHWKEYDKSMNEVDYRNEGYDKVNEFLNSDPYKSKKLTQKRTIEKLSSIPSAIVEDLQNGTWNFANDSIEESFYSVQIYINKRAEKIGFEINAAIPAMPKPLEDGSIIAVPVLTTLDNEWISMDGDDVVRYDKTNKKWVVVDEYKARVEQQNGFEQQANLLSSYENSN